MEKWNPKEVATDIYQFCKKNDLWMEIIIYFDGKAWSDYKLWNGVPGKHIENDLYEYENKDPKEYFAYVRQPNILSMSFEGALYDVLNGYYPGWVQLESDFQSLFTKRGLYYELGNAWNLSAYEI